MVAVERTKAAKLFQMSRHNILTVGKHLCQRGERWKGYYGIMENRRAFSLFLFLFLRHRSLWAPAGFMFITRTRTRTHTIKNTDTNTGSGEIRFYDKTGFPLHAALRGNGECASHTKHFMSCVWNVSGDLWSPCRFVLCFASVSVNSSIRTMLLWSRQYTSMFLGFVTRHLTVYNWKWFKFDVNTLVDNPLIFLRCWSWNVGNI